MTMKKIYVALVAFMVSGNALASELYNKRANDMVEKENDLIKVIELVEDQLMAAEPMVPHFSESADSVSPPNINDVTYGFNVFLGLTPSEQRGDLFGEKLFSLTEDATTSVNGYKGFHQISDFSAHESCYASTISNEVWWGTSSSTLSSQSTSSSNGLEVAVTLGVSVPLQTVEASAETTIENSLVFGNSQTSTQAFSEQSSGRTYSFDAKSQRRLYTAEIDYASISTWTDGFKNGCSSLSNSLSRINVLNFFNTYGTHGLVTAGFGQKCTSSLYMESGQSMSTYYEFASESSTYEAQLMWWTSSNSQSESSEEYASNEYGFGYEISDRQCSGEIATDSSCGGGMSGTGRDSPAIVSWTYKPVWEMNVPELSQDAKNMLKSVFESVMAASVICMRTHCNGNGACAPNKAWWTSNQFSTASISYDEAFDGEKCFCLDEYVGNDCGTGREIVMKSPVLGEVKNEGDGVMSYNDGTPLCGMESWHDNYYEDRQFQFRTCDITESDYAVQSGTDQVTDYSVYDAEFTHECEPDKVMIGIESHHSNYYEDRQYRITCRHFKDTRTDDCDDFPILYVNEYDYRVSYTCSSGKVLTGINSVHSNHNEDRRFKFKCCSLVINKTKTYTWIWIVCGRTDACTEGAAFLADPMEAHEVRCCSDVSKDGWLKNDGCNVWGESDLPTCYYAETYSSAQAICEDNGARLCTKAEIMADCTLGSGCNHDHNLVWTSTSHAYVWIACGLPGACTEGNEKLVDPLETHEVRCCSDVSKDGWVKNDGCNVWGESDLPTCYHAENYISAQNICEDNGARLCTKAEMLAGCTVGSGCNHDLDLMWTMTTGYDETTDLNTVAFSQKTEENSLLQTLKQIEIKQEEIEGLIEKIGDHN